MVCYISVLSGARFKLMFGDRDSRSQPRANSKSEQPRVYLKTGCFRRRNSSRTEFRGMREFRPSASTGDKALAAIVKVSYSEL